MNEEDLIDIFDLKASIHTQNHNPNGLTHKAAQKINIQTCKNSQKTQELKSALEIVSSHNTESIIFLKLQGSHTNQNHSF